MTSSTVAPLGARNVWIRLACLVPPRTRQPTMITRHGVPAAAIVLI
jgi:hypothetical protein